MTTELLSPAGSLHAMRVAFAYGADAVYAGQPRYSLRVRENEFHHEEKLAGGIAEAKARGKAFYLACNIAAHNDKLRSWLRDLAPIIAMGPDALIMSDPGLIMLTREHFPDQAIHLSVQANAVNWATVAFWQKMGLSRVILSRELSLEEIADIREHCPTMEVEVFVHGALCIAYSGRCLLSGYMTHRDANQGACTNACRWQYRSHAAGEDSNGDLVATHGAVREVQPLLLEEISRPGELMPAYEDEHGTYIMNSKDLRAVQHVARLVGMGVHSLKIEGRTKSPYYVARTAQVYRRAIDAAARGEAFDWQWAGDLDHLANRGYTEGFYRRHAPAELQNYLQGSSTNQQQQWVGEVREVDRSRARLEVEVKNRFATGDRLELMSPRGSQFFTLTGIEDSQGRRRDDAPGSGHRVRIVAEELDLGGIDALAMLVRHPQTAPHTHDKALPA